MKKLKRLKSLARRQLPRSILWRSQPVRLFSWKGDQPTGNFGDQLSKELIERLFAVNTTYAPIDECELVSIGSVLQEVEKSVSFRRPLIWGSGFIAPGGEYSGAPLDIRAVRGQLSLQRVRHLTNRHIALGDPGVLTPLAFPEVTKTASPDYSVSVIPHYVDQGNAAAQELVSRLGAHHIDVMAPVSQVIKEIATSRFVISSSLHGVIVAESFGVTNAWVQFSDQGNGGRYKFDDFYSAFATKREPVSPIELMDHLDRYISQWRPLRNLAFIQSELMRSFPMRPAK